MTVSLHGHDNSNYG